MTQLQRNLRTLMQAMRDYDYETVKTCWLQMPDDLRTDNAYIERIAKSVQRIEHLGYLRRMEAIAAGPFLPRLEEVVLGR